MEAAMMSAAAAWRYDAMRGASAILIRLLGPETDTAAVKEAL
jgi:hypothetical protein